jgi:hypothetical protein
VPEAAADVILDVEFEEGLFFLVLENVGDEPAHAVRVRFAAPLRGLGGERRFDRLRLFRHLEFLPPQRLIRVFFDRSALFFGRGEPTQVEARVTWQTDAGERRTRTIRHDLDAYRDFPYLEVPSDATAP